MNRVGIAIYFALATSPLPDYSAGLGFAARIPAHATKCLF
jgi:hypothetical protein